MRLAVAELVELLYGYMRLLTSFGLGHGSQVMSPSKLEDELGCSFEEGNFHLKLLKL